jgi:nitrilase
MAIVRIAACHAASVFLSAKETAGKAVRLIQEASRNGANVVVFPETYVAAFPAWSTVRAPTENHSLFQRMVKESVCVDGEEVQVIRSAARDVGVLVSLGLSEKSRFSTATLYNSNLLIDRTGDVLNHHRKLMPTFFEKLTWSPGDGHGLSVSQTPFGNIGNLICGENTNPLARYTLIAQAEQIHISTWPAIWPTRSLDNTEGTGSSTNYDNVTANKTRAAAHCFEAKCFGVLCSGFLDQNAIDIMVSGASDPKGVEKTLQQSPRGASLFLDPAGSTHPAFTISERGERKEVEFLQNEEGIIYADLDLERCIEGKQYHDVVGGYQRLDIFQLQVNRTRPDPVVFTHEVPDEETGKTTEVI